MASQNSPNVSLSLTTIEMRPTLRRSFTMHGQIAAAAHVGHKGVELAIEFVPDVVLLDLSMPGLDDFDVAAVLRQTPVLRKFVLIAYTARNDAASKVRALASGFDRYLSKPS